MRELDDLKVAVSKMLRKTANPDEPYIANCNGKWSANQLADEIEKDTDVGKNTIKGLILLSTDLVLRGKKEL